MPNRWKVVIGGLIVFVLFTTHTLWELMNEVNPAIKLRDTATADRHEEGVGRGARRRRAVRGRDRPGRPRHEAGEEAAR
jgi:hypothetical protein